jgi:hypothetical protein
MKEEWQMDLNLNEVDLGFDDMPMAGTDKLIVMLDSSVVSAEQPGLYFENGRVLQDSLADLQSFYDPIERALLAKLQSSITAG